MTLPAGLMIQDGVPTLPGSDDLGTYDTWTLPLQDGEEDRFQGRFLGMSSSRRPHHENHDGSAYGTADTWTGTDHRCGACRWFEPRIFGGNPGSIYVLYKLGATIVPGEENRISLERVGSAFELIELLSVPRGRKTVLTIPGREAVVQAAGRDTNLQRTYLRWQSFG